MKTVKELIKKILKESEFDWATDIEPSTLHKPYVGMKFRTKNDPNSVYEIFDLSSSIVYYKYISTETGREVKASIPIMYFNRYMKDGDWVTHYVNEDFDWTSQADEAPNYQGHPQGVVYLRTHDEIKEFFNLLNTYGVAGKRNHDAITTQNSFHEALEDTRDRYESDDWGGHSDWVPTISASFFISKKDPTKYDTGYWDYDVEEDSVEDWLVNEGCEHEVIDCENWRIYTDISHLRTLFNDYTGEVLHKTKSGKPIKVGDKVKVIDPDSNQYGEVLEVEHLVGGDGYEKHGGAFQSIEFDTLYFAGHEVEHIEDLNEDFDWVGDYSKYLNDVQYPVPAYATYNYDVGYTVGGEWDGRYWVEINLLGDDGEVTEYGDEYRSFDTESEADEFIKEFNRVNSKI